MVRKFTDKDAELIWNLIHSVQKKKVKVKEANRRLQEFHTFFYEPSKNKSKPLKVSKQLVSQRAGTKTPKAKQAKQEKQEYSSQGMNQKQFELFMEQQKALAEQTQDRIFSQMMAAHEDAKKALLEQIKEPMEEQFYIMNKNLKRLDQKTEKAVKMLVGGSSWHDIGWQDIPNWFKSQFKKGMGSMITAPVKLTVRGVKAIVYHTVIDPIQIVVKTVGGGTLKGMKFYVGLCLIAGGLNVILHAEHYQLPQNQIEIDGRRLSFNPSNIEGLDFDFGTGQADTSQISLLNQYSEKTPFQFYVSDPFEDNLSYQSQQYFIQAKDQVQDLMTLSKRMSHGQLNKFVTTTLPENAPGAYQYTIEQATYISSSVGNFISSNVKSAVSSVVPTPISTMFSWVNPWGSKGGKKPKKIRKHKGINQNTGRLNKGYKYSGKKLKSGLKQIIKKNKK
mgnify:CR=1 FL=1